jgi:hypothetical protein
MHDAMKTKQFLAWSTWQINITWWKQSRDINRVKDGKGWVNGGFRHFQEKIDLSSNEIAFHTHTYIFVF